MKFVFGKPVDEPFDREEEVGKLRTLILRGQSTSVIGVRRIGKTSILLKTLKEINLPKVYVNVEVFTEGKSVDLVAFLEYYSALILSETLRNLDPKARIPMILRERGESVINALRDMLGYMKISLNFRPMNVELFLNKGTNYKESVRELLDLPQLMAEKLRKRLVVVMDEFQYLRLAEQNYPGLFHLLRSKWQFHKDVVYVVSGSSVGLLERMFSSGEEPFYQFFFPIYVKPFDRGVSLRFLKSGLEDEGKKYSEEALAKAVDELDGIPAWLNYFGLETLGCEAVEQNCVAKTLERMYNDPVIVRMVEGEYNKLGKNAKLVISFLARRGGMGNLRGVGLRKSSLMEGVNSLLREGYLTREGRGVYRIVDPVIAKVLRIRSADVG
jgi:AAA+ ATPase superfamily predicted ATPase